MSMVVTRDISIFGGFLTGKPQAGVMIEEAEAPAVIAGETANAASTAASSKSAVEMAEELSAQTGRTSVRYNTPTKTGHIDLKDVRNPAGHFDKASGGRITAPTVQERLFHRGPNGRINVGRQTTRPATRQDIRTARKLIERQ